MYYIWLGWLGCGCGSPHKNISVCVYVSLSFAAVKVSEFKVNHRRWQRIQMDVFLAFAMPACVPAGWARPSASPSVLRTNEKEQVRWQDHLSRSTPHPPSWSNTRQTCIFSVAGLVSNFFPSFLKVEPRGNVLKRYAKEAICSKRVHTNAGFRWLVRI